MVDSISGSGAPPSVKGVNKVQNKTDQGGTAEEAKSSAQPVDSVSLSDEAIEQAKAEQTAREARSQLQEQADSTLSSEGQDFSDFL